MRLSRESGLDLNRFDSAIHLGENFGRERPLGVGWDSMISAHARLYEYIMRFGIVCSPPVYQFTNLPIYQFTSQSINILVL